jgi:hypothetical protein
MLLLTLACSSGPTAVIDGADWLSGPWPSGDISAITLPETDSEIGTTLIQGWTEQAAQAATGWSHFQPVYFPFDGPLEDLDVVLVDSQGNEHPIEVAFIDDALGDPFLADNTLVLSPRPDAPLTSGETYTAIVSEDVAQAPEGYDGPGAISTSFTVQDSVGQLQTLARATDDALDANPDWLQPTELRRVAAMSYSQGETPSGKPATVVTVTFEDGEVELSYLDDREGDPTVAWDLLDDWPMEVWQTSIRTVSMRPLEGMPWASPGVGLLTDFNRRHDGWMELDALAVEPEWMRVVIQVPKTGDSLAVMTWDHGTAGHAYNAVHRANDGDHGDQVAQRLADAGVVVVSRDQPLYGTRYPLIDDGFSGSIGFYNIGNLPAFRDNQRQGAVDNRVLNRFATDALPSYIDGLDRGLGSFGHSLGSVTNNLALVMDSGADQALQSGTGGYMTFYVLSTGLLGSNNSAVTTLGPLLGIDNAADASPSELVAALAGVPEEAWPLFDHRHPVMNVFQIIMDPSDPLAIAPAQTTPQTIVLGVNDLQVPNTTTEWLSSALGAPHEVVECTPSYDYDGHYCAFREPAGMDAWTTFGEEL